MPKLKALFRTCHPLPSLAVTAMFAALIVQTAPHGLGPGAAIPAVLLGELSIGWSNDYFDADRDRLAGRLDKPLASGAIPRQAVLAAALVSVTLSLVLAYSINAAVGTVDAMQMLAGWFYNAGIKGTPLSGLAYAVGFGLIPEFATSTAPSVAAARPSVLAAAALLGVGGHLANALPDLEADRIAGVRGLPNVLAERFSVRTVRSAALTLLVGASGFLALAGTPWLWLAFAASAAVGWWGMGSFGRKPFYAALAIAGIDVTVFVFGGVPLS
ncbi:UbiA family prenyltransferase [Catenulispora subtropica]|uniref:UbiA family prenyltransferase n=1 Tax=Catenulispora subtropica TaxID=450798 RepID=A0ABP5EU89_9ACTN